MVQTRGQQTGDQSPSSCGALRGVTAEGDAASTTVTSGATLKPAVSVPSTEHSADVLMGPGRDEPVFPAECWIHPHYQHERPYGRERAYNGRCLAN